jgi:SAM-dependent methyltransferase
MDARKLAQCYDEEVLPGWDAAFVDLLCEEFPAPLPAKAQLLEIGCTTGRLTETLMERLPEGGRLIAIEDVRELMEIARGKVAAFDRKRVFFKKEPADHISFSDGTFDAVLSAGLAPIYDLAEVLGEVARLLKPDGAALLGVPMRGSFQELLDIFREVLEKEDLFQVQNELDRLTARLPDRLEALRLLNEAGLVETRVGLCERSLRFADALEFLQAPLVRTHCLEQCLDLIQDRSWREGVLAGMVRSLDTYFPDGIELTLVLGRLSGTRA